MLWRPIVDLWPRLGDMSVALGGVGIYALDFCSTASITVVAGRL
jgi:hypothetical protein